MAHRHNGSATDGTNLGALSTGTTGIRRGIPLATTPGFIGEQYSHNGDDVFLAGHTNHNLNPSNNANITALGIGHDSGGVTLGGARGVPSTGMTNNMSSTLSSPTPGPVPGQQSHYADSVNLASHASRDYYSLNNASARAFEMTHGSSSYVNDGNAFGAPVVGNTTPMSNNLSTSTPRSRDNHNLHYSDSVYGTRYPNVNPNRTGTAYGSSSDVSNRTGFGVSSTSAVNTMSGTTLGSTFGAAGNRHLQQSDGYHPTGYSTANPNLSNSTLPTNTGTAPGSHGHATNDTTVRTARDSSSNAATDTALAAQVPGNPPTLRSNFSPSAPNPATGPDGRARWPCTTCGKTFSRQWDVTRHAKIHSDELPFQCRAPDCTYKGSNRRDNLAKHKLKCGH